MKLDPSRRYELSIGPTRASVDNACAILARDVPRAGWRVALSGDGRTCTVTADPAARFDASRAFLPVAT